MRIPASLASLLLVLSPVLAPAQTPACKPTITGHVETISLASTTFHNTRNLYIWLPPGYGDAANAQKKYPVLYILDGDSAFDACGAFLHDELHADETLTELITAGKIPPVIAVGIQNASDILGHDANGQNIDGGRARSREYLPYPDDALQPVTNDVIGQQFPGFLEREVMPAVTSHFRALTGAQNSALWGDSYAGAQALYIALHRPDLFDRVIIESPSIQAGNGQLLRDSVSLVQTPGHIALGVGTEEAAGAHLPNEKEISAAVVRLDRTLAANLQAAAYMPPKVQFTVGEGAHHTTSDFGKRLAAGLLFIYGK